MPFTPNPLQTLTLGGGCFWCTEAVFVQVRGVVDVEFLLGETATPKVSERLS